MKIISYDPGVTTGFVVASLNETGPLRCKPNQWRFLHINIYNHMHSEMPDIIVCESFEYRNRAKANLVLYSREMIGVIELYCQQVPTCELIYQPPSTIAGYFSDKRLKDEDMWIKGKQHAMDALRHMLHWYKFGKGFQFDTKEGYRLS